MDKRENSKSLKGEGGGGGFSVRGRLLRERGAPHARSRRSSRQNSVGPALRLRRGGENEAPEYRGTRAFTWSSLTEKGTSASRERFAGAPRGLEREGPRSEGRLIFQERKGKAFVQGGHRCEKTTGKVGWKGVLRGLWI